MSHQFAKRPVSEEVWVLDRIQSECLEWIPGKGVRFVNTIHMKKETTWKKNEENTASL